MMFDISLFINTITNKLISLLNDILSRFKESVTGTEDSKATLLNYVMCKLSANIFYSSKTQ